MSAATVPVDEDLPALEALWERSAGVVADGGGAVPAGLLWHRQVRTLYLRGISIDAALAANRRLPLVRRACEHQALPHCATPNHGALPRMVQYLTYLPQPTDDRRPWI